MQSMPTLPRALRPSRSWLGLAFVAGLAFGASGCERIPDPCVDFKLACLSVTIPEGPSNVRRIQTQIHDGLTQYMQPTPTKPPKENLVYPLRFAIRFGEFENSYRGFVELKLNALSDEYDVVGFAEEKVSINGREKKAVTLRLITPPAEPDMADPLPDMAGGDLASSPPDLAEHPDMP